MKEIRVLYSFPYRMGKDRICNTAYYQVYGLVKSGAKVTVLTGSLSKNIPDHIKLIKTLSIFNIRIPIRIIGRWWACILHDWITSIWLKKHSAEIDIFHGWPLGSLLTLKVAKKLGIKTFLERPNAHTSFAYRVVKEENIKLKFDLPFGHDHNFNARYLKREKEEYEIADYLLCPSDFVIKTFINEGFKFEKLRRHQYGFNENKFKLGNQQYNRTRGLVVLYAGVGEPRKGLHLALEAWISSEAYDYGKFIICGDILPAYFNKISLLLKFPGVEILGVRSDLADLMKKSDVLVLSSVEEGSALVTYEARAAGCVILVSEASGAICHHEIDSLVHPVGNVDVLRRHFSLVNRDRNFLAKLREESVKTSKNLTWDFAGIRLKNVYIISPETHKFF